MHERIAYNWNGKRGKLFRLDRENSVEVTQIGVVEAAVAHPNES